MPVRLDQVGHRHLNSPWLFRGLTVQLQPGVSYALTGPSGSGKSTLLALLAGWAAPAEGTIQRDTDRINWVFQNPHGVPGRRAIDFVAFPFLSRGVPPRHADRHALTLLHRFGLTAAASREFSALSGGESQRLMLARAVASEPELLLVDEPTAQLDSQTAAAVNGVIGELRAENTIVVIATHDPDTRDACDVLIDLRALGAAT